MQTMIHSKNFHSCLLLAILVVGLFGFAGCQATTERPSPESSKRALKLRGFDYDEKFVPAGRAARATRWPSVHSSMLG